VRHYAAVEQQAKGWFVGHGTRITSRRGLCGDWHRRASYHSRMFELYLVARGGLPPWSRANELALEAGSVLVVEPGEVHTFVDSSPITTTSSSTPRS